MREALPTLVLTRSDVETLLTPDDCRVAVEQAFRAHAMGHSAPPAIVGVKGTDGGFHIKAGLLRRGQHYFAAKINGNFAGNAALGMPRIQGVVVLCDGDTGVPLALIDSAAITMLRTAAATAIAAQYLARQDASIVTVFGCGAQSRSQLAALARVRPIRKVYAFDLHVGRAQALASELRAGLQIDATVPADVRIAAQASDIIVTCTSSSAPLVFDGDVSPGAFVAAVGADSEQKQELDPALLASVGLVTDVTAQCALIGDLHHALSAGTVSAEDVHAELGEIVAGMKPGRRSADEIIVFDSTGMALQDVAAAAAVYEAARRTGRGSPIALAA